MVAVAHTEGAGDEPLNNRTLLLRTLAGFMVHPNVGAVLAVDDRGGQIGHPSLQEFMRTGGYPLENITCNFFSLSGDFEADLARGAAVVSQWLPDVTRAPRGPISLAHLNLALQCGGSDAFSGVSANPLAAAVAGLCAWVLLPLATLPLAAKLIGVVRTRTDGPSLNAALAQTGMLQLVFCVLLSAGVLFC